MCACVVWSVTLFSTVMEVHRGLPQEPSSQLAEGTKVVTNWRTRPYPTFPVASLTTMTTTYLLSSLQTQVGLRVLPIALCADVALAVDTLACFTWNPQ